MSENVDVFGIPPFSKSMYTLCILFHTLHTTLYVQLDPLLPKCMDVHYIVIIVCKKK